MDKSLPQVVLNQEDFPDIIVDTEIDNPYLSSPNSLENLYFYMTLEVAVDPEVFVNFIKNAIKAFRKSKTYKIYKGFLMEMGLDKCQKMGNINSEMATLEMHHNILNIFEISVMITQHVLNTFGYITTFDLVYLLKQEHRDNNIPIAMLSETAHEMYHDDPNNYIPIDMTFGKWWILLSKYRFGITVDIAFKIKEYINRSLNDKTANHGFLLDLRMNVENFSIYNSYGYNSNVIPSNGYYLEG